MGEINCMEDLSYLIKSGVEMLRHKEGEKALSILYEDWLDETNTILKSMAALSEILEGQIAIARYCFQLLSQRNSEGAPIEHQSIRQGIKILAEITVIFDKWRFDYVL